MAISVDQNRTSRWLAGQQWAETFAQNCAFIGIDRFHNLSYATKTHIRHVHTEYDRLIDEEGYDRESARFFVIEAINVVLTSWRATRLLDADDEEG